MKKLLKDCKEQASTYQCLFTLDDANGIAYFRFHHTTEWRRIQIICLDFRQLDDEDVERMVTYRINSAQLKSRIIQQRLKDITDIVEQAAEKTKENEGINIPAQAIYLWET